MDIKKLKQLALLEQIGGPQQPQEDQSRMAMGLIQALMQQQGEKARSAEQADYHAGLLRQGQEGIDVRKDAIGQQKAMNEAASGDRQMATLERLAQAGDPVATRALAGMNPAYGKAKMDMTNEANTARQGSVNQAIQGGYSRNANDPAKLKAFLDTLFADPVAATATPGATRADVNAAPWGDMNAGLPSQNHGPGIVAKVLGTEPLVGEASGRSGGAINAIGSLFPEMNSEALRQRWQQMLDMPDSPLSLLFGQKKPIPDFPAGYRPANIFQ